MFENTKNGKKKAKTVADKLSNHLFFKSHGRKIGVAQARKLGLKITSLKKDQTLQDLILSVFHLTTFTFDATPAAKIIENNLGFALIKRAGVVSVPMIA